MAEDFMKLIDDLLDKGINPRKIEIEVSKLKLSSEEQDKALKYLDFKIKHFGIHKKVKKNGLGVALSLFFILIVSGIFSTGIFFSITQESEVEMFSPPVIEEKDLREFNVEPLTKTGKNFNFDEGMTRGFFYNNKKYSLTLLSSGKNYADIEISVDNTYFTIYQGRELKLDLDLDGEDDIVMMLLFTEFEKANLKIKIIDKIKLEQIEESNKISCDRDEDCDDNNITTYDICDSTEKYCINEGDVVCKFNEDCLESENLTVRCIKKRGKLPYCEYLLPDKCNKDSDCDDGNFTTEDVCIILPTTTNYCEYKLMDEVDCGKTKDSILANKTEIETDEAVKCFNNYLSTDFDLDIRYMLNETRIDVEIIRLKRNKSNLFVEFEKTPYLFKEYEDEYFECEFKDEELINLSKATKKSKTDAIEFIENVLVLLKDPDFFEDYDCVGNLNSPPTILNIPELNVSVGSFKYFNLSEYVLDEEDDLKDLNLVATNYLEDDLEIDFIDYNNKMKLVGINQSVQDIKLVVTDTEGESSLKIVKITVN